MDGYTSRVVSAIAGVTPRQLHHWDTTGFVKPSVAEARGYGSARLYSFVDLVQLKTAKTLRDGGISLQKLRKVVAYLRAQLPGIKEPFAELALLTDGETVFVLTDDPEVMVDTLRGGQLVFSIAIGEFIGELQGEIKRFASKRTVPVRVDDFEYQVVLDPDLEEGGYVVECPSIPGCMSQGETEEEALEMIADAIRACLTVRESMSDERATATS